MVRKSPPVRGPSPPPATKDSRSDGDGNAIQNRILLNVPNGECDFIFDKLTLVNLSLHDVLQEVGQPIQYGYFPNTAMASILNIMSDGKSVEVGLTGPEGFVGLPLLSGFRTSASRVVTQGAGTAFRIKAEDLQSSLGPCPQLQADLQRYSQEFMMEVTQIAACNRLHEIEARLARWLLMTHDRIGSATLPLTQEFLSQMLGTRRASVSVAAAILQRAGLIQYVRGQVVILDRMALEKASCECYAIIQRQLETWRKESF